MQHHRRATATRTTTRAHQLALIPDSPEASAVVAQRKLAASAQRTNTVAAYQMVQRAFAEFCERVIVNRPVSALPATPQTVAHYLTYMHTVKGFSRRTMVVHKSGIRANHLDAGYADPTAAKIVRDTWTGIIVELETRPDPHAPAEPTGLHILFTGVRRIVDTIDRDLAERGDDATATERLAALRDRALILLTASSGYLTTREAQSLRVGAAMPVDAGIRVSVRRSPDKHVGDRIATILRGADPRYCPIAAMDAWIRAAGLEAGTPVFRAIDQHGHIGSTALSLQAMAIVSRRRASAAGGVDPQLVTMRSWRGGAMQQAAYDGAKTAHIRDDANLSEQSTPILESLLAGVRRDKDAGRPAPEAVVVIS